MVTVHECEGYCYNYQQLQLTGCKLEICIANALCQGPKKSVQEKNLTLVKHLEHYRSSKQFQHILERISGVQRVPSVPRGLQRTS